MRVGVVVAFSLFLAAPGFAQQEKPGAAVAPLAILGEIGAAERTIVFNTLQSYLSNDYQLIPQVEYARAEERAFQELELEQCTVEQCIRKIQEILQVERLFVLQIIRARAFTQVSLTLVGAEVKIVKAQTCENCSIGRLNEAVAGVYASVVEIDLGRRPALAGPPTPPATRQQPPAIGLGRRAAPPVPTPQPVQPRAGREFLPKEEPAGKPIWPLAASAISFVLAYSNTQDARDNRQRAANLESQGLTQQAEEQIVYAESSDSTAGLQLVASLGFLGYYLFSDAGGQPSFSRYGRPSQDGPFVTLRMQPRILAVSVGLHW